MSYNGGVNCGVNGGVIVNGHQPSRCLAITSILDHQMHMYPHLLSLDCLPVSNKLSLGLFFRGTTQGRGYGGGGGEWDRVIFF